MVRLLVRIVAFLSLTAGMGCVKRTPIDELLIGGTVECGFEFVIHTWQDTNTNGRRDVGESPFRDVTVSVTDSLESRSYQIRSDEQGQAKFALLFSSCAPHGFEVAVTTPSGFELTTSSPQVAHNG